MRVRLMIVAALLALGVVSLMAQDDAEETLFNDDYSASLVQSAQAGTLVEDDDGALLLTLSGIAAQAPALLRQPQLAGFAYPTRELADDWLRAEADAEAPLVVEGLLVIGDLSVPVLLNTPAYDDMAQTIAYAVALGEVTSIDPDAKDVFVPEAFEQATLFLLLDGETGQMLAAGRQALLDDAREMGKQPCNPILQRC